MLGNFSQCDISLRETALPPPTVIVCSCSRCPSSSTRSPGACSGPPHATRCRCKRTRWLMPQSRTLQPPLLPLPAGAVQLPASALLPWLARSPAVAATRFGGPANNGVGSPQHHKALRAGRQETSHMNQLAHLQLLLTSACRSLFAPLLRFMIPLKTARVFVASATIEQQAIR